MDFNNKIEIVQLVAKNYTQMQFNLMKEIQNQTPNFSWPTYGEEIKNFAYDFLHIGLGDNAKEQKELDELASINVVKQWQEMLTQAKENNEVLPVKSWDKKEIVQYYLNNCVKEIFTLLKPFKTHLGYDNQEIMNKLSEQDVAHHFNKTMIQKLEAHLGFEEAQSLVLDNQEKIETQARIALKTKVFLNAHQDFNKLVAPQLKELERKSVLPSKPNYASGWNGLEQSKYARRKF